MLRDFDCKKGQARIRGQKYKNCENHANMSFSTEAHIHINEVIQFDFISSSHSASENAAFGLLWKGAVLGSISKLWERATGQSAHQHRRSEHSAQT